MNIECYDPSSFLPGQQKIPPVVSCFINLPEQSVKYQLLGMSAFSVLVRWTNMWGICMKGKVRFRYNYKNA